MGKRKTDEYLEEDLDSQDFAGSSHRKHRKHKKHRHRHLESDLDNRQYTSSPDTGQQPAIKLRIKFGGQTIGTKSYSVTNKETPVEECYPHDVPDVALYQTADYGETSIGHVDVDSSEDERTWLDALEAGTLDDNGELRRQQDISLLTARQRALLHGASEAELQQLPSGYKQPQLTEEQLHRRQQRAKKRKQQAQEKSEKDKKDTLERLLKKQEAKSKGVKQFREKARHQPSYRYVNNLSNIEISVPPGFHFPLVHSVAPPPRPVQKCGVLGCTNPRKYSCSRTGVSLCSLQCYKANLTATITGAVTVPVT